MGKLNFGSHKDQKGFAPVLILLMIVAVVGVGGFAYWRVSSYKDDKDSTSNSENTAETTSEETKKTDSTAVSDDCVAQTGDENICHLGAIADLSKYSSEVHLTLGEGSDAMTAVTKYDGKGNYMIDAGGGLLGMSVGGKYYMFLERWYDTGDDPSQVPEDSTPSLDFATTAGIKYENLGKEPCGDDTCFNYKLTGGMLGDGVVTTLFGDKDYLPRSLTSTGGFLGALTMTVEYKDITITAPADAVPISELGNYLTQ